MPQPIPCPPKNYQLGHKAIAMRPALAIHIANIAARWTMIENQQGVALAMMLKSEGALAMYMALSSAAARTAALRAAADHALTSDFRDLFEQQILRTKKPQNSRNTVVHSVWAASDEYQDAILQTPAKEHMRWFAARVTTPMNVAYTAEATMANTLKAAIEDHEEVMAKYDPRYMLWREPDFVEVENRISSLSADWGDTLGMIEFALVGFSLSQWQSIMARDRGVPTKISP